jgi:hypothetical protein
VGAQGAPGDAVLWVMVDAVALPGHNAQPVTLLAFPAVPTSGLFGTPKQNDSTHGPGAVPFAEPTVVDGYVFAAGQVPGTLCTAVNTCGGMVVSWH